MAPSQEAAQPGNPFVMPAGGTLLAWLFTLDNNLTTAMGGILSERENNLSGIQTILDLACGSGGWVLDVASQYPKISAIGVDLNESLINYAISLARAQGLDNASFRVMNILHPMDFPDESFDLVNARTLFSSLAPGDWPPLIQECKRLLRPGGVLRLTELERFNTSSLALEQIWDSYARAFYVSGRSFSPDGKHIGIIPHLGRFLHEVGFQHIHNKAHTPEISGWAPAFAAWLEQGEIAWTLNEPFILSSGVLTQEEFRRLRHEATIDMLSPEFSGIAFFLTVWGSKPEDHTGGG